MKKFIGTFIADCLALLIADGLLEGISFSSNAALVAMAFALALLNMFVRPILKFFSFPLTMLTFGLFSLVINGAVIMMASNLSEGATVSGLGPAILTSFIVSIVTSFICGRDAK